MIHGSRHLPRSRRGSIFITALGIIVILSGMILVFAQSMRTEGLAAANRLSSIKAAAIERGAEQWVLAQIESYPGDAVTITQTPVEAVQVGEGYFWILHYDPDNDQTWQTGITDEAGKLNLNTTGSNRLQLLPGVTPTAGDSIADWRSPAGNPRPNGAMSSYYESLAEPYDAKNGPFETVEELMLVQGVDQGLLFGLDRNRNGYIEESERTAGGDVTAFSNANGGSRGIFNFVTPYSREPNTTTAGGARVNVNSGDTSGLNTLLTRKLSGSRAQAVIERIRPLLRAARNGTAFNNLGVFYLASGMSATEFGQVVDSLTATSTKTLTGLVNVNTAPKEVLTCLPGLTEADADALIANRPAAGSAPGYGWIFSALPANKALAIAGAITGRSFFYSADIVAVSGDGRAFSRARIVVDAQTPPAKIVYRKDLTALGWPLPAEIRGALRGGKAVPTGMFASPLPGSLNGLPG